MTIAFDMGSYGIRVAVGAKDLRECQLLRHRCFFASDGIDADRFDASCVHYMIAGSKGLAATFRVRLMRNMAEISSSYSADSYDLSALAEYNEPILEIGRFCVSPENTDPNVLRICWGVLANLVEQNDVGLLIGCTSFNGIDCVPYLDCFHLLARKYSAPPKLRPRAKAREVISLAAMISHNPIKALSQAPPLLRTYLSLGGWVSDHAVVDRGMNTIHIFTALEVANIPPDRAKTLRAITGSALA